MVVCLAIFLSPHPTISLPSQPLGTTVVFSVSIAFNGATLKWVAGVHHFVPIVSLGTLQVHPLCYGHWEDFHLEFVSYFLYLFVDSHVDFISWLLWTLLQLTCKYSHLFDTRCLPSDGDTGSLIYLSLILLTMQLKMASKPQSSSLISCMLRMTGICLLLTPGEAAVLFL